MKTIAKLMALCLVLSMLSFAQGTAPAGGKKTDDTKKTSADKGKGKGKVVTKAKGGDKDKDAGKGKGKGKGKSKAPASKKGWDDKGGKK